MDKWSKYIVHSKTVLLDRNQIQIEIYLTFTERANGNKFAHKKAGLHGSKDLQVLILFLCW